MGVYLTAHVDVSLAKVGRRQRTSEFYPRAWRHDDAACGAGSSASLARFASPEARLSAGKRELDEAALAVGGGLLAVAASARGALPGSAVPAAATALVRGVDLVAVAAKDLAA